MNFDIIKQAGISQSLFAELCGVSRVTVNSWVKGHTKPHGLYERAVHDRLRTITQLVEAGHLPIHLSLRDPARNEKIKTAMAE